MNTKTGLYSIQIVIFAIYLTIGFLISIKTPLLRGRDELAHFRFIRFIAQRHRLPTSWQERKEADYKSEWPPLFQTIVGLMGQEINIDSPPFIHTRLTENNPRVQLVFGPDKVKFAQALITSEPYQGEFLLWYLGRWVTLLISMIGLGLTYLFIHASAPSSHQKVSPWLAVSAVAALGFTFSYLRDSTVISYDPLLTIPIVLYLILLFYLLPNPNQTWPYFGLGLLMGIAGLAKYTPLTAVPVVPIMVIWWGYRDNWNISPIFWRIGLFGAGLLLTFGSWLIYMWLTFNQINDLGWLNGSLYPFLADNLAVGDQTSYWFANLITGEEFNTTEFSKGDDSLPIWFLALLANIFGNQGLGWLFLGLFSLAGVGLIRQWFHIKQQQRLWVLLLIIHLSLFLFFPILRFLSVGYANTNTVSAQHVIFPAGAIVILLLIIGLRAWLTPWHLTTLFSVIAIFGLWQSLFFTLNLLQTTPLPVKSVPLSKNEQVLATFNGISLLDYNYEGDHQSIKTILFWRSDNFVSEDYYIELTLTDSKNQPQARWIGHPLNGRYPTRAWMIGDRVEDTILLPIVGLPSDDYQLNLHVLDTAKRPINDKINLGQIKIESPAQILANNTISIDDKNIRYALWPQEQSDKKLPLYEERSTITLVTSEQLSDDIRVGLINPNGEIYNPLQHIGHIYNFIVEPHFVNGRYRFRFEKWSNEQMVEQVETIDLLQIQTAERQFEIGPITHLLQANFARQATLIGYDLPQRKVKANDKLPLTLHWQALQPIGGDLITYNRVLSADQKKVIGEKDRRVRGIYSTLLWAPNEIVTDPFNLDIKPNAPDGIYYLLVGLYLPVGESAVSLPLVQNGELTDITSVRFGPIKVGQTPAHLVIENPNPQHSVDYNLGDEANIKLLGYDLKQSTLTLYWQLMKPLFVDYTTFVHIRNQTDETVAQKDQPPLNGAYPTGLWDVGEMIADDIVISLPKDLPTGDYQVIVGFYDFETGQRLYIPDNPANEIILTSIQVP